ENSAVFAPMHSASVSAAVRVNALSFQSSRRPTRRSDIIRTLDANRVRWVRSVPGVRRARPLRGQTSDFKLLTYSVLSASDGCTRAARQAGIKLARAETPSRIAAAPPHEMGSLLAMP